MRGHRPTDQLPTNQLVVSQVADWSTRGLDDSQTSQLAEIFDAKFGVHNLAKCDTVFRNSLSVGELTIVRDVTDRELVCRRIVWLPLRSGARPTQYEQWSTEPISRTLVAAN